MKPNNVPIIADTGNNSTTQPPPLVALNKTVKGMIARIDTMAGLV
ncbi:MAG: hypothetical protein ACFFF4_19300 [Candidatus Thorarchaeota archaeon]